MNTFRLRKRPAAPAFIIESSSSSDSDSDAESSSPVPEFEEEVGMAGNASEDLFPEADIATTPESENDDDDDTDVESKMQC